MYFKSSFIRKLFRLGILFTIALVLLDLLAYFFYQDTEFGKIFLATREQTPLTWVSVVVLLFIALACATAYTETKSKVWYTLSALFFFFSLDDAVYFHERFASAIQQAIPALAAFPSYSWVVLYLPLLVFGLGALVAKLWVNASRGEKKILVVATALLFLALVLDMLDGWVAKSDTLVFCIEKSCNAAITHFARLSEEILEILGLGVLARVTIERHSTSG